MTVSAFPHSNKDIRHLFDWHTHQLGLNDLIPASWYRARGRIFKMDESVLKFRDKNSAEAELLNTKIYQSLKINLPSLYTIQLDQTTKSFFKGRDDIRPNSHLGISPFISGNTLSQMLFENKDDMQQQASIHQTLGREMLIPCCIGEMLDPHGINFIWNNEPLNKKQFTLIDAECGWLNPFTMQKSSDTVTKLFEAMVEPNCEFNTDKLPWCNLFFSHFREGYRSEDTEHYRQQCDDILNNLYHFPSKELKEKGIYDVLVKRTQDLKAFV